MCLPLFLIFKQKYVCVESYGIHSEYPYLSIVTVMVAMRRMFFFIFRNCIHLHSFFSWSYRNDIFFLTTLKLRKYNHGLKKDDTGFMRLCFHENFAY